MKHVYKASMIFLLILLAGLPITASEAVIVRCDQCTEEQPCATLFEFENLKFVHYVSCSIDLDGQEKWNSTDKEKFDMFYFESPGIKGSRNKMKI